MLTQLSEMSPCFREEEEVRGGPSSYPQTHIMEPILTQLQALLTHPHVPTNICTVHPHICVGLGVGARERGGVVREPLCD